MIRMYDLKNKIRVSYTYDSFYSQHYYETTPPTSAACWPFAASQRLSDVCHVF